MYNITKANAMDMENIKIFLKTVEAVKVIDENILGNASIIYDNEEKVVGIVSFETFNLYGLIRYFIFKKNIDIESIRIMFDSMLETAKENEIQSLFSIVTNEEVSNLFRELGFSEVNKNKFFIEEESFHNTKYRDSSVMIKYI